MNMFLSTVSGAFEILTSGIDIVIEFGCLIQVEVSWGFEKHATWLLPGRNSENHKRVTELKYSPDLVVDGLHM
jgi:hypothetical protein